MFIPIRTDRRLEHVPWMNIALIAVNAAVFMISRRPELRESFAAYLLYPQAPRVVQFISYQFLHADWMHLIGNMLFLWVFGNSVEDRLNKVGYLAFYIAGGIIAGLGHVILDDSPVLGASGSVAAVSGAYLALFPRSNVTIVYWFIFIGAFEVPSVLLILLYFGYDALRYLTDQQGVAYAAHMSGYIFGFSIGAMLLVTRLLPREPYDLISLWEHRRRRAQFHKLAAEGFRPWEHHKPDLPPTADETVQYTPAEMQLMQTRARITQAMTAHDLQTAAELYSQLLEQDPGQVLGQQQQLDIANQLMSQGDYALSARAYELFLNTYRAYPQREQVELILGLIYARYLDRRQRAIELLKSAITRLHDEEQKQLAHQTLAEIG